MEEHGELQGRAHVVRDISALDTQFGDYSRYERNLERGELRIVF